MKQSLDIYSLYLLVIKSKRIRYNFVERKLIQWTKRFFKDSYDFINNVVGDIYEY